MRQKMGKSFMSGEETAEKRLDWDNLDDTKKNMMKIMW